MDSIEHFRKTRRAWQKLHGRKNGRRLRAVDMSDQGEPVRVMADATRQTFCFDDKMRSRRRPHRRRTALWSVS